MKIFTIKNAFIIAVTALFLIQCSSTKPRKAASVLDNPENHYVMGKKLLKQNNLTGAQREFELAKQLNPKYAPAYEGLALVAIENGNLKKAEQLIDQSLDHEGDWVPAQVAKGRLLIKKGAFEDAVDELEDALDDVDDAKVVKNKKSVKMDAWYWKGQALKQWGKYGAAQTALQQVLELDNSDVRASLAIKELAEYQAAVAGQSPTLRKIAAQKEITRSDVAVLFVTELPLEKIFRKSKAKNAIGFKAPTQVMQAKKEKASRNQPGDVKQTHWAHSYITQALEAGIITAFPDGNFYPDKKVNRAEFAMLIQQFMVKADDDTSLRTKHFGDTSPYADVLNTSPIFNAIMVVTTRGVMSGMDDGTFHPLDIVSGAESLNIIRKLKAKF